jgi:hypothetical protein
MRMRIAITEVVEKGLVQLFVGWLVDRTAEVNAGNLDAGMTRQGRHRKGIAGHRHFRHDASQDLRHFAWHCSRRDISIYDGSGLGVDAKRI